MPLVFRNLTKVKQTVTIFAAIHRLLFSLMLAIPLLVSNNAIRLYVFVATYTLAYMLGTFVGPSASNWLVSLVPPTIRGRYLALREGIMISTMTVISVIIGVVIDYMKTIGNEALGYGICSIVIFIFTIFNILCLVNIKEPPLPINRKKITFKNILTKPFKNKPFRKILVLSVLWNFGLQIGGPFFAIYFYSVLGLNYTYIMLMNVLMYAFRVFAAQYWGRLADKKNWVHVTKLSLIVLGLVHAGYFFMNETNYLWLYPPLQSFAGIGWGGLALSMFNLQFEYAPEENRASYISVNTAIGGIAGFSAILIGSAFVSKVTGTVVYLGSMPIHGIQYLLLTSGILILLTSIYVHKVIKHKEVVALDISTSRNRLT